MYKYFFVVIIGYLFGCLQWSYIFSMLIKKVDIRTLGGKNAGASNAVKVSKWYCCHTWSQLSIFYEF